MGLSYTMVRWLTHGLPEDQAIDPTLQRRAILLRGFANDLTRACNDYARMAAPDGGGLTPASRQWIDRTFRSEIRFLEHRMDSNPMERLEAYRALHAAVRRCGTMARHPDDRLLRAATLGDVRRAVASANAYLSRIGMSRHAGPAPVRMVFGESPVDSR